MKWKTLLRGRWLSQWISKQVHQRLNFERNSARFPEAVIDCDASIQGNVVLHDGVNLRKGVSVRGNVEIGRGTFCNGPSSIRTMDSSITIGAFCSLASYVALTTADHPVSTPSSYQTSSGRYGEFFRDVLVEEAPINVGCDVWIARGCSILKGVSIGHGAIIAAGAVVTSDVPPYAIYGGIPAKLIRNRFSEETIDWLLSVRWWNWNEEELRSRQKFFSLDLTKLSVDQLAHLEEELGIHSTDSIE